MSTIKAGTTIGTALVTEGDTTGQLVFQTNGTTTALTIGTNQTATFSGNVAVNGTLTASGGLPSLATPLAVVGNATAGAEIRLPEDTDNGANYVAIKAPNALAANLTLTLPTADGTNGQYLQTNGSGQLAFATVPTTSPAGSTGQLQYNNAGAFAAISSGTSGQVLQSAGAGTPPTWASPSSGMTLLASYTPSNTSSLIIDTFFTSTYDKYLIYVTDFVPPSSAFVNVRFYIGGVLQTGAVYSNYTQYFVGGYNGVTSSSGQSNGLITPGTATTWNNVPMCIEISEPTSSRVKGIFFNGAGIVAGGNTYTFNGGIGINNTGTFTGLQFTPSSGTFSGKFYLFGLQK